MPEAWSCSSLAVVHTHSYGIEFKMLQKQNRAHSPATVTDGITMPSFSTHRVNHVAEDTWFIKYHPRGLCAGVHFSNGLKALNSDVSGFEDFDKCS